MVSWSLPCKVAISFRQLISEERKGDQLLFQEIYMVHLKLGNPNLFLYHLWYFTEI